MVDAIGRLRVQFTRAQVVGRLRDEIEHNRAIV
jgi:hypothetical protein